MKPPSKQNGPGASYSIDVMEFIAQSIETIPELAEWLREHEKMVVSLSVEQRAEYDRREKEACQASEEVIRSSFAHTHHRAQRNPMMPMRSEGFSWKRLAEGECITKTLK